MKHIPLAFLRGSPNTCTLFSRQMSLIDEIFSCTRCGYCCHGETTVSLDSSDQTNMIATLDIPADQVRERYWLIRGNIVQMKTIEGHCIFFNEGCTVHPGRPWRCRQWPLHPSILIDENNFHSISESCPGINRNVGYDRFCEILRMVMDDGSVVAP